MQQQQQQQEKGGGGRKLKQYGKEIRKEGVWAVWGIANSLVLG